MTSSCCPLSAIWSGRAPEQRPNGQPAPSAMDQYRVEDVILGRGTFGTVKLAQHKQTGQKFAFKMVSKEAADWKLLREIDLHRTIEHRHVTRLTDVFEMPDAICMVLELAPNGDLFDYIVRQGRVPEVDARRVFQQIVSGVDHCHAHMIVHRDIKPENILMGNNFDVKIADFGFAARMIPGELLKSSCGSPNYAAPELFYRGCAYRGPEVDIWSCGVVLYALLCGELPFDEPGLPELIRKIKMGSYRIPGCIYGHAKDFIQRILNVDPEARISMPQIWEHAWFRLFLPPDLRSSAPPVESHVEQACQERRVDPMLENSAVTLQEMCLGLRDHGFTLAQLQFRWESLKLAPQASEDKQVEKLSEEPACEEQPCTEDGTKRASEEQPQITEEPREEAHAGKPCTTQALEVAPLVQAQVPSSCIRAAPQRRRCRRASSSTAKLCSSRVRRRSLQNLNGSVVACKFKSLSLQDMVRRPNRVI
mmetsp:Transcript_154187/g.287445  ORF Transcript_154187/g.287445 Transcript_154187/m.287445 type:complete len:478 (+) Transcript_154187:47-1480(+)